jgi:hypothetical protein
MSFTPASARADRSFELVRQSLLQSDGLPFADAMTTEQMREAFDAEGISFGEAGSDWDGASDDGDGVVYTMGVTLWAMLSQALFTDVQRSCRAAVQRVCTHYSLLGVKVAVTNTGAYCRARAKVTEGAVRRLAEGVAERCERAVPDEWRWKGFRTRMIDGTTFSMPDTKENQAEYPQPSSQAEGLGFPIARAVALTSLDTGMVVSFAMGPYSGKETGETALFRTLLDKLQRGDLLLSDRYFGGWFTLALLRKRGVEVVTLLHQFRDADFRKGKRLGTGDHVVTWPKPAKPNWLDQETYDQLPGQLEMRECQVKVRQPGFRKKSLTIVSSLLDDRHCSVDDLAALYRRRWAAELELRDIKSTMKLDILRRKTPAAMRQELWTGLLAYNLVRQSMLQSAHADECRPDQLSFAASLQMLANNWAVAAATTDASAYGRLVELRIANGRAHRVANRPDRVEPRAVKRRRDPIALLSEPRKAAQEKQKAGAKT